MLTTRSAQASRASSCCQTSTSAVDPCGQGLGTRRTAIEDHDPAGALVAQVTQCLFAHFAGTQQQHMLVMKRLEELLGEVRDGHARDADPPPVDVGFRSHALGHAIGCLEGEVNHRAGHLLFLRHGERLFHLRQDLCFAHHHAVEAGGDREQMPRRFHVGVLEHVAGQHRGHPGRGSWRGSG